MDVVITIISVAVLLCSIIGCLLPVLPGPPLGYLALLILQLRSEPPFSTTFMMVWAAITVVVFLLDYVIPPLTTRKFGGSKHGMLGSTAGLILGLLFFPPFGLIVGAFVGAFLGELFHGQNRDHALRSAVGSFVGFLTGSLLKLVVVFTMGYYLVTSLW